MHKITNQNIMKIIKTLILTLGVSALAACQGPVTPESTDGHQLWFYSMDQDGMNLSSEKTTMAIAENEIQHISARLDENADAAQTQKKQLDSATAHLQQKHSLSYRLRL